MIELLDVSNFTNILIHRGKTHEHTSGCVLVGNSVKILSTEGTASLENIAEGYEIIYPVIADIITKYPEQAYLKVINNF